MSGPRDFLEGLGLAGGSDPRRLNGASPMALLMAVLNPHEADPVSGGLSRAAEELEVLMRSLEAGDDGLHARAVERVRDRLLVLAELHHRQMVAVGLSAEPEEVRS